jgi:hypothetical protein
MAAIRHEADIWLPRLISGKGGSSAKHNIKLLRNNDALKTLVMSDCQGAQSVRNAICYSCHFPTKPLVAQSFSLDTMLAKAHNALDVRRMEMEPSDCAQEPMWGLVACAGFIGNIWIYI